jgi:hypothetical protein
MHMGFRRMNDKNQEAIFGMFMQLCRDETPLVRRMAAQNLEHWTRLLSDHPHKQKEIMSAFKSFINDDQVRYRSFHFYFYWGVC